MLIQKRPVMVGLQNNEKYGAIFKEKNEFFRIIIELTPNATLEIVTFLITTYLPRIEHG